MYVLVLQDGTVLGVDANCVCTLKTCAHLKLNEGLRVVRMVNLICLFYHRFIYLF